MPYARRFHRGPGLLLSWLVCAWLLSGCGQPSPTPSNITPTVNLVQESSKIDSTLRDLLLTYQTGGLNAAREYARSVGLLDDQDRVRFGLTLTSPAAVPTVTAQIQKMGGVVYSSSEDQLGVAIDLNTLTAYFNSTDKRNFFQELASFKEISELKILLRPALATLPVVPPKANEALGLIGADRWQTAGFRGQNITVGIIDGGFAGYTKFLGTALPNAAQIETKSFLLGDGLGAETHGVAVAEIVHSIAPEASLIFAPIEDEIGFTRAVQYLMDRKVQIIQISLGWAGLFPGDGTGRMDEKLDEARRAGILPVVSTGNYGLAHYAGTLATDENDFVRFQGGQTTLKLKAEADSAWVALHWLEKWDAPQTNLDLYVLDNAGRAVISSRNVQGDGSTKPPTELAPFRATPSQTYSIQIRLNGPAPVTPLKFHLFAYNATLENATAESSLATPGDAHGALSVGATNWKTDQVETYSSRGPTLDGRDKPEIVAPTGINSRVMGGIFAGTSASAPQVAGTVALVWCAAPEMTVDQVAVYLARHALDLGTPGRDPQSGFGRLRLGSADVARAGLIDLLGAQPSGPPFQDNFQKADSGLPNNAQADYQIGKGYVLQTQANRLSWQTYLGRSFEEFRADVRVQPGTISSGTFYGLLFWQQGPDDYWAWLISEGRYLLTRRIGGRWQNLTEWKQDAALQNGPLSLSLEATGSYLRMRANDNVLQSLLLKPGTAAPPPARLGGKFGFLAGQFPGALDNPGPITFQNLSITPLSIK